MGRNLVRAGPHAKARYDMKAYGCSPTALAKLRRSLGWLITPRGAGRCLTTALAIDLHETEPAYATVFDILESWFQLLCKGPQARQWAKKAWEPALDAIACAGKKR